MDDGTGRHLFARDNISDRGRQSLVVTAVLTSLATVVVALRIYARAGILKIMGREDWIILVAWAFSIAYLGLVAAQATNGMGVHADKLEKQELQRQLQRLYAAIPLYNASLACSKFSILFQYLRIFPGRAFRLACYIVMLIVGLYSTWAFVSGYLNCVPVAKFWDHSIPGHCLSFEALWFFNAGMNIATDVTLMILPMPLLSQLQLPRMQKLALMGVFAVGGFVVITSCLRLASLRTVAQNMDDASYSNVGASYWTAAECNVAIICACLPLLRPLLGRIFPNLMATNSYKRYGTPKTYGHTGRSNRLPTDLFTRDRERDYDMYSINVKPGDRSSRNFGGIEVTTQVVQETTKHESTSDRRLVLDPS
ncbi:integral membrane protein [Aspergillus sclerotialis]|uniref:Integral membrane protein n=1 Tax=Aspergillus sclerotialis TaxID=2070753 RepID=A0A3A2Z6G1_9EURO|nr:integral membrane protein [Aspergillus sclerotialis]